MSASIVRQYVAHARHLNRQVVCWLKLHEDRLAARKRAERDQCMEMARRLK